MNAISETGGPTTGPPDELIRLDSVLVADDDAVSCAMLESHLRKWRLDVVTVHNGIDAWDELQKEAAPSLIILDWMMPGISGVDLCRKIRAQKNSPYPYIILLTARDAKKDLVEGLEAGADDYLTKPFDADELRSRLMAGSRILRLQNELLRKEEELRFEALHDRLTGLWNREAILNFLGREVARGKRSGDSVGVLMLDVDHFKSVNDNYGHQVGDAVLQEVGRRLVGGTRRYDWAGRYGGEEFLILLCNCNPETLAMCAERLREAISSQPVQVANLELKITVSLGAALTSADRALTGDQMVGIADAALYRAKNRGRNCVDIG
jgi:two-component system cell cycle response regulator